MSKSEALYHRLDRIANQSSATAVGIQELIITRKFSQADKKLKALGL